MSEYEKSIIEQVTHVLDKLNIRMSNKGYTYWIDAIAYAINNIDINGYAINMSNIYKVIAAKYNVTPSSVERALRHSIVHTPGLVEQLQTYFNISYTLTNMDIMVCLVRLVMEANKHR